MEDAMTKSLYAIGLLLATVFAACNSVEHQAANVAQKDKPRTSQVETVHADGVRRITLETFDEMIRKGEAFIVDVRNQAAYDQGHIPGAKLIPSGEILNHLKELPRDKTIVTYCS
jgi:3-mercaptopyruvate sulfurtransferase SseA